VGTDKASWPAKPAEILLARRLVAKPRLELLKRPRVINPSDGMLRAFHPSMLPVVLTCMKGIPTTCNYLGEFTAARAYVERGLALYDPTHRLFYADLLANDMLVQLLVHSTMPLACLGHIDQASFRAEAALAEAR